MCRMRQEKLPDETNMSDTEEQMKSNKTQGDNGDIEKVKLKACTVVLKDIFKFGSYTGETNASVGSDTASDLLTCNHTYGKTRTQKVVLVPTQDDSGTTRFTVKLSDTTHTSQCSDSNKDSEKLNNAEENIPEQEVTDREEIYVDLLSPRTEPNGVHQLGDKTKTNMQKVVILSTQVNIGGQEKTKFTVKPCDESRECDVTRDCGVMADCGDISECDDMSCSSVTEDSSDTEDYSESTHAHAARPGVAKTEDVTDSVVIMCTEEEPLISTETGARTDDVTIVTDDSRHKRDRGETLHRCRTCGKTFWNGYNLKQHKTIHDANRTHYACSVCGWWFRTNSGLIRHKLKHKRDTGDVVNRAELTEADVCVVTLTDTGVKSYPCPVCGQLFRGLYFVNRHRQKQKRCLESHEKCDTLNTTPDATKSQEPTTSQIKPHKCSRCARKFLSSAHLKVHAQCHTSKRYPCSTCGKCFKTSSYRRKHSVVHTDVRAFSCKLCGKTYKDQSGLSYHMITHTGKGPQVCDKCGKSFLCISALKNHSDSHLTEKTFSCPVCDKSFVSEHRLREHNKIHTGIKPHLCVTCGKAFRRRYVLRNHMLVHSGDTPHVCETCGKAFKIREQLKIHMRTHTGEKPYPCGVCGASFAVSYALVIHNRIHTNVKPYTCTICGKSFVTSSQIKTHEKSHSGIKPHACTVCGQTFTLPHQRRAHEKTHKKATKN